MKLRLLSLGCALLFGSPFAAAGQAVPCGTVRQDTTLNADCQAPLIVTANDIKIDLNGFRVSNDSLIDYCIRLENRSGVAITNGMVGPCLGGVLISGGSRNQLSALSVSGAEIEADANNRGIVIQRSSRNVLNDVRVTGGFEGVALRLEGANRNVLRRVTAIGNEANALIIAGSANGVSGGSFSGFAGAGGTAIYIVGSKNSVEGAVLLSISDACVRVEGGSNVIRDNTCDGSTYGIFVNGGKRNVVESNAITNSALQGIAVEGSVTTVVQNAVAGSGGVDLTESAPVCNHKNSWSDNTFQTDVEGDGPSGGCIR